MSLKDTSCPSGYSQWCADKFLTTGSPKEKISLHGHIYTREIIITITGTKDM